jgi:class 3 adenylate cyclase
MPATLTEMSGDRKGYMHVLETEPVFIGRSPDVDIVVPNALMSRKHARVWWDGEKYMVEDLGTRNGTLVNREPVTAPRALKDGDEVVLPGMVLTFRSTEETMMFAPKPAARAATLTFLFADLRGYTNFTETLGDAAAAELVDEYRTFMRAEIARSAGAEIRTEGDSFFVTFESAAEAMRCAIAMLREAARRSGAHPDRPIVVGIGLHAGEPVRRADGDLVGSAINVAARLCSNAGPMELFVSEVVRGLVRTSGIAPMEERTGITLKGVQDPPRIYAVDWKEGDPQA